MRLIAFVLMSLIPAQAAFGDNFHWKDAPKPVRELGKALKRDGEPNRETFNGFPNVNATIEGSTFGNAGRVFDGGLFGNSTRGRIQIERKFDNTSQIDVHYIKSVRKVYWEKDTDDKDDGGRVRILVVAPDKNAEGEEGDQGYPQVVTNWEFGHGERNQDKSKYGNVAVIIYPTKVKAGEKNTVYYHLEWNK